MTVSECITERAAKMGINISAEKAAKFERYHDMLVSANEKMNLTRVSEDIIDSIDRNYLDSIAPVALDHFLNAKTIADIGAGAGFPSVPLAIMLDDTHITMLDALGKRVEFLNDVCESLKLNAHAVHIRAEDAGRKSDLRGAFDIVTARAVSSLNILAEYALPLLKTGGYFIAYKGPKWKEELENADNALEILGGAFIEAVPMDIPERDWEHVIVIIQKTKETPEKYPRRTGVPEKKPL